MQKRSSAERSVIGACIAWLFVLVLFALSQFGWRELADGTMEPIRVLGFVVPLLWLAILVTSAAGVAFGALGIVRGPRRGLALVGAVLGLPLFAQFSVIVGATLLGWLRPA